VSRLLLRTGVLLYVGLLILVPLGSVVYRAFANGFLAAWQAITTPDALHALWLTVFVALIAVPADAVFGVGIALLLARRRFRGAALLDAAVDLPLAMSPVVIGVALLLCYGRTGWFGDWLAAHGIQIIFAWPGIVFACALVALPYVVRAVLPVLQEAGTVQEQAASTLGAGPVRIFFRITLPTIRHGLVYGCTLTTARVLGEFGAVTIVSGAIIGKTQTLTLYIQSSIENLDNTAAYATALLLALVSLGVLAVLTRSTRPKEARPWESPSALSPSGSAPPPPSTPSASVSQPVP
jgi:sulfate/thiosulfate transport system permease protein